MPKVIITCSEVVKYHCTLDMADTDYAEYEAAEERDEGDDWFAAFAERFVDRRNHLVAGDGFEDTEVTLLE